MPGGPTDDDGWGDAADEQRPPARPAVGWGDDDEPPIPETEAAAEDLPPAAASEPPAAAPEPPAPPPAPPPEPSVVVSESMEAHREAPPVETVAPPPPPPSPGPEKEKPKAKSKRKAASKDKPPTVSDDEGWTGTLAEAAGIEPPPSPPRGPLLSRRGWVALVLALIVVGLLGAGGVLSHLNSEKLYLVCGDDDVRAERGRWFPWGRTSLDGDRWKPFKLPGVCESRELDSMSELEAAFLDLLVTRASTLLASEAPDLEEAETLIEQGLALSRAPEHKPKRTELERLRGDVEYWRGRAAIDGALDRLRTARGHYDEALKIGPRHAGDADLWVPFIDHLVGRVEAGPGAASETPDAGSKAPDRPDRPPTAPTTDAAPPATPVVIPDAGPAATPEPDAGVPRGGVLL